MNRRLPKRLSCADPKCRYLHRDSYGPGWICGLSQEVIDEDRLGRPVPICFPRTTERTPNR